jgi:hypothetical protein
MIARADNRDREKMRVVRVAIRVSLFDRLATMVEVRQQAL